MSRKQTSGADPSGGPAKIRLDKWLWAARFFKTRSLAKKAIDGGKVECNGARGKSSRDVEVGATLKIRQGWDDRTVIVRALSEQRRGAPEAALLYEETAESIERRRQNAQQRKAQKTAQPIPEGRPGKRNRRELQKFKRGL